MGIFRLSGESRPAGSGDHAGIMLRGGCVRAAHLQARKHSSLWRETMNPLLAFFTSAAGAFVAAWAGAYIGFRRGKRERALDRQLRWHEDAIQALAQYEEQLERLRGHALNTLVVHPRGPHSTMTEPPADPDDLPKTVRAPALLWEALAKAESQARALLRLGDLYPTLRVQVECSTALTSSVNMVASHWIDVSPEPVIRWTDLSLKATGSANLRRSLQESLRVLLEVDGLLSRVLGGRYRRWAALRAIKKLKAELRSGAS